MKYLVVFETSPHNFAAYEDDLPVPEPSSWAETVEV